MMRIYSLVMGILLFFAASAQNNQPPIVRTVSNPYASKSLIYFNKTLNCVDSVRYPQSKLSGLPEVGPLTNNTAAQTGISQAYHLTSSATILGIGAYLLLDFDGIPGNFTPVTAKIKVYNIDGQNYPTTPIDSTTVQVSDLGFNEQVLMFASPISVSDSFAIAIEMGSFNATTDTIWYTTNICGWNGSVCTVGDGNSENLSCVLSPDYNSANGSHWFNNNIEVFGWNIDMLMHPIVETSLTSLYTVGPTSVCPNDTLTFLNVSSVNTDAMFNLYNSTTNPLFSWNFDDGTGPYTPFDTTYAYPTPGSYNTGLTATYYGYSTNCFETSNVQVTVFDTAVAYFGADYLGGSLFQMNDSSTNAMTYSWDFGDGSPINTSQNPQHTFLSFPSYVCLTVTDSNGCNSNTYCDTVVPTNINPVIDDVKKVSVYPIPANKYFYVGVPSRYFNGSIVVTDVVGKMLKTMDIGQLDKIKIATDNMSSGIYFVSVDYLGERVFTQRIVIDK